MMKKYDELLKKFGNLRANREKMCGYLADYFIDEALETEDYGFIWDTIYYYLETKDSGYIATKFDESGLSEKVDDVDFSVDEWINVKNEMDKELEKINNSTPDMNLSKDRYLKEMIKKRRSLND